MARAIYTRLGRPSTAIFLLCFCLLAPVGWKAIIGADDGIDTGQHVLVASATPPSEQAGLIDPLAAAGGVIAALKGRVSPSSLGPPASLPIVPGANWSYFKGIFSAPPSTWNTVGFDDTSWLIGPSGFGYGDGDDATILSDMQNPPNSPGYVSVYVRKEFNIPDLGSIAGVKLTIDYDDAYVVYINGAEAARSSNMGGTVGTPPAYNATAVSNHEASAGANGNPPNVVSIPASSLVAGTNAIGIEVHNGTFGSSDLTLIPRLEIELPPNAPPDAPSSPTPANLATGLSTSPELCVTVDDEEGAPLDVTFYGREGVSVAGDPFTIIALPDTQYYSASFPATYTTQTTWLRDNRVARNIVFTTQLGDCTDSAGIQAQWDNANAAWVIVENPTTTGLLDGMPYGIAVGNHDQNPSGSARSGTDENITTALYNQNFGKSRFSDRAYFGGNFPLPGFADSMDNHYELFSGGGMDFISFHLEWDNTSCSWPSDGSAPTGTLTTCQQVLTWVRGLLTGPYANHRAMITTHFMGTPTSAGTGTPSFSPQGQSIFNAIKTLPNVFLLLGGHLDQADHRTDLATDGHPIHTVLSDFQSRPNGGNGWLRIMTFDPQADTFHIETYSPVFNRFINKLNDGTPSSHADNVAPTENEITLAYDMDAGAPFVAAGADMDVPAGLQACVTWPGLQVNTTYEWYAVASDGSASTTGSRQSFTTTTTCSTNAECDDADICTDDTCNGSQLCEHSPVANCCNTVGDCDDANICTDDACTSNACVNTNNNGACNDGNACTVSDFCSGGTCASGSAANCDDGNACTTDSCVAPTGCSNSYTPTPGCCSTEADCDDGNAGTTDSCSGGDCVNQPNISCNTAADCNDNSVCTTDSCSGGNAAAISFAGTAGNRVQFPIGSGVDYLNDFGTGSFTVEGWVYTDGGAASLTGIFRAGRQQAFPQVVIQLTGTGNLQIAGSVETNTTGTQVDVTGPALTANTWTHVALVVDRTAGTQQLRLHVNGGAPTVASGTPWATNAISWTTEATMLGAARDGSGNPINPFDGRLDEFRIWNYARTQAEIAADMGSAITSATGLVHRWGMNEGIGTTTADSVGTSSGTLTTTTAPAPSWLTSSSQVPAVGTGTCQYVSVSCDDGNLCTTDSCNAISGCGHAAGNEGGVCDDVNPCTSLDLCTGGACAGIPNGTCCLSDDDCYDGNSCTTDSCDISSANAFALSLDGTNDYVTMGVASGLGAASFTLETWFNWTGGGVGLVNGTGTGGLPIGTIPLFSKGAPQIEAPPNLNMNYFLGIANGRLAGDFEDSASGLNHPVCTAASEPALSINTWHHAAATYDGTRWRLYLNGAELVVDTACSNCTGGACTVSPGATPESGSIQHFGIGTALNSSGTAAGFFQGLIDETRVWNIPRTLASIQAGMNTEVTSAPGLIGRWGFAEGADTSAGDSTSPAEDGTLTGGPLWEGTDKPELGEGTCQFTPAVGASCEDNNLCITGDTCDANGTCQPGTTPAVCDDGNVCTDDSCDNEFGCVNTINVAPCDDGSFCTMGDTCDGGTCTGGAAVFCDDGDICTTDSCNPATGCATTPVVCNDGNLCTDDSCQSASGCVFTPDNTNSCGDGEICNGTETCSAGVCQSGSPFCGDGDACSTDTCSNAPAMSALAFDGTNDYVTMNVAAGLGATRFTLETWFYWTGGGTGMPNGTGTGGLPIGTIPLFSKGAPQVETPLNLNMNYFLGIANSRLAGDFEDSASGLNHPVCTAASEPAVSINTWHHAAVTYDGTRWRLYLDGAELSVDTACSNCAGGACTVSPGATPESGSIQHFGLGTTLSSTGAQTGFFQGQLDEVRVWDRARSASEIVFGKDRRISTDLGLLGRWGLDQSSGTVAPDSTSPAEDGTLTNITFTPTSGWVAGAPALSPAECSYPNAPNGTACSDGNICTTPDQCTAGVCGGSAVAGCCLTAADCNDSDVCTTDTCNANACTFSPIPGCVSCTTDAQCDDANTCTAETCNTANDAAADLRTTTDYVNLGQDTTPNNFINNFGTSSFTVEGWFYADGFTTDLTSLFRAGRQGAFNQAVIQLRTGPYVSASVEASPSAQVDTPNTAATVTLNQWHHVAMVVDRTLATPQVRIYLNGNLAGSVNTTWTVSTVVNMPAGDATLLGATRDAAGTLINNFNGRLDEWRIWSYGRTQAEIQADRNREIVSATGLVHRWSFNEASGNAIDDPGTFDGVMTGGATRITTTLPLFGNDLCVYTATNNGASCNDGNACTVSTTCGAGVCGGGSAENCDDGDLCTTDTCDAGTGCDHAPVTPPAEVINLVWIRDLNDTLVLSWTDQGLLYDLAGGFASQLGIDGGTQNAVCVPGGDDYPNATFDDTRPDPSVGETYYYLVRSQSACGSGTYGYSSTGVEHLPTAACQ